MSQPFHVLVISDATGDLAYNLAVSAVGQFEGIDIKISRRGRVRSEQRIQDIVREAKKNQAVIVFTMVSEDLRRKVLAEAKKEEVAAMDIMGPTLDFLSHYFHKLPSAEPGLQYRLTRDYSKRTEAIEFTVRHDEGTGLDTLEQANIVLLGISRCAKTPLSIYLAYQGYLCANIPIVVGMPLPEEVKKIDPKKIIGLILDPEQLSLRRSMRLKTMGRSDSEEYANTESVRQELDYAQKLFAELGSVQVVDVTGKAIEEVAAEVIQSLGL